MFDRHALAPVRHIRRLTPLLALLLVAGGLLPAAHLAPRAHASGPTFVVSAYGGLGQTRDVALGDLNGDGALDVMEGRWEGNIVYLNDGAGHPSSGSPFGGEHVPSASRWAT